MNLESTSGPMRKSAMTNPNDPNQPYGQQPGQPYGAPQGQPYPPQAPAKKKRKWPWILLAVVVVIIAISALTSGGNDDSDTTAAPASNQPGQAAPSAADPAPADNTIPPLVAAPPSGDGKQIVYEVISDSATLGNVTWFDEQSDIQQESSVAAPWSLSLSNNSTFAIAGVTAQTDGQSVTCRVTVDGDVKDEQTSTGQFAVVSCNAGM